MLRIGERDFVDFPDGEVAAMLADLGSVDDVDTGTIREGGIDYRAAVRDRPFYPFRDFDHEIVKFA